uniref:Phospholipid scramblase n=1 Tax=Schistosoma curassoni TaxID=6186 RepID=A0A183KLX8_9TREM
FHIYEYNITDQLVPERVICGFCSFIDCVTDRVPLSTETGFVYDLNKFITVADCEVALVVGCDCDKADVEINGICKPKLYKPASGDKEFNDCPIVEEDEQFCPNSLLQLVNDCCSPIICGIALLLTVLNPFGPTNIAVAAAVEMEFGSK